LPAKHWEINYTIMAHQAVIDSFIKHLEYLDEQFFASDMRKESYLAKDKQSRTIIFSFGEVTINRRRYALRSGKGSFFFIDSLLGIPKYQRVSKQVIANILHSISYDHLSYQKAAQPYGLSKAYVYKLIKRLNPDVYMPYLEAPIKTQFLHLVADEDHVAIQDNKRSKEEKKDKINRHMVRHVTLFTDIKTVSKGRNKLVNRMIFSQLKNETITEFCERINSYILDNYMVTGQTFVYGDGASWISKTLPDMVAGTYIHDKFHMKQALMRVCGGKKSSERTILEELLDKDEKDLFKSAVEALFPDLNDYKKKNFKYILSFWDSYQRNFKVADSLWCCAEGINSHYFSEYFSSRPKGFSIENIHKIGYLLSFSHSRYDIRRYFIDNENDFIKSRKSTDDFLEDKYYEALQASIPVIDKGLNTYLFKALKGLSH
ncbi:MAG: UPF0236 family transposase-like protein, partial [bacterium]